MFYEIRNELRRCQREKSYSSTSSPEGIVFSPKVFVPFYQILHQFHNVKSGFVYQTKSGEGKL